MRSRILPAVGISAVALVAATAFAPVAGAHTAPGAVHHGSAGVAHYATTAKTCYSQGTSLDGNGISSQNFEASFDIYDDQAADDFKVGKAGCTVKTVSVAGTYSSTGGVQTANVTFYKDASGIPGAVIKTKTAKVKSDSAGALVLSLGKKGIKLGKGETWVSVQVNLDFSTGGQWYWSTATDGGGSDGQWQNPGGGFGIGCATWCDATTAGATSPEFSFSLS